MKIKQNTISLRKKKMINELILALCDADQCNKIKSRRILREIFTIGEISAKL